MSDADDVLADLGRQDPATAAVFDRARQDALDRLDAAMTAAADRVANDLAAELTRFKQGLDPDLADAKASLDALANLPGDDLSNRGGELKAAATALAAYLAKREQRFDAFGLHLGQVACVPFRAILGGAPLAAAITAAVAVITAADPARPPAAPAAT